MLIAYPVTPRFCNYTKEEEEKRRKTAELHTEQSLVHLIHHCPGLQSAHLDHCRSLSVLFALMSSCPSLLSINLSGDLRNPWPVDFEALAEHPEWVPNLRELSLSWTGRLNYTYGRIEEEMEPALRKLANARPNLIFSITSGVEVIWARVPSWIELKWYRKHRNTMGSTVFESRRHEEASSWISRYS